MLSHPLRDWLHASSGPKESAQVLGQSIPLRRLESRTLDGSWWHFDGGERLGSLPLAASVGSALLIEAGEHPQHWLLLLHDGSAVLEQGRRSQELRHGDGAILPGQPWTLLTQEASFSWLSFDPLQLLSAARQLGGPRWQAPSPRQSPLRWACFLRSPQDSSIQVLLDTLNHLLISSHKVSHLRQELLENLLLEQQVYRWLALLLFEDLRDGHEQPSAAAGANDPRLESLIDFISLHLNQPLSLQLLEQQSNYSRRTLHYLFHQRFGCSPMQWIRQLRMAQALERLSHPQAGDSVKSVAAECGYRSLSQFGLDFQRAHNRRPSEALRAGRSAVA